MRPYLENPILNPCHRAARLKPQDQGADAEDRGQELRSNTRSSGRRSTSDRTPEPEPARSNPPEPTPEPEPEPDA